MRNIPMLVFSATDHFVCQVLPLPREFDRIDKRILDSQSGQSFEHRLRRDINRITSNEPRPIGRDFRCAGPGPDLHVGFRVQLLRIQHHAVARSQMLVNRMPQLVPNYELKFTFIQVVDRSAANGDD